MLYEPARGDQGASSSQLVFGVLVGEGAAGYVRCAAMRTTRTIARKPRTRVTFAAAALALFGLLAMHGWGTPGSAHHGATAAPEMPAMSASTHTVSVDDTRVPAGHSEHRSDDPPGHSTWLLGLCLALLAGLLLGLALLFGRRRVALPDTMLPRFVKPPLLTRDRDPPDVLRLCVIRC